jgi:hypothetical protein
LELQKKRPNALCCAVPADATNKDPRAANADNCDADTITAAADDDGVDATAAKLILMMLLLQLLDMKVMLLIIMIQMLCC